MLIRLGFGLLGCVAVGAIEINGATAVKHLTSDEILDLLLHRLEAALRPDTSKNCESDSNSTSKTSYRSRRLSLRSSGQ